MVTIIIYEFDAMAVDGFSENASLLTLPEMGIAAGESEGIKCVSMSFDWHSFSEILIEKYVPMCTYSFRVFLPEMSYDRIEKLCETVIDVGYNNPVDAENADPYAVFYSGSIGIKTRFAIGQTQMISIVPITEAELEEYTFRGIKTIEF